MVSGTCVVAEDLVEEPGKLVVEPVVVTFSLEDETERRILKTSFLLYLGEWAAVKSAVMKASRSVIVSATENG